MKWVAAIAGVIMFLLGGLWFLQGTGLVVIAPIACVGECTALTGPHLGWALAGSAMLLAGGALLWWGIRRIARRP